MDTTENPGCIDTVRATVSSLGGDGNEQKIMGPFSGSIENIVQVYDDLSSLSRNRNTYNSSWAFSFAFSQMRDLINHLFTVQVTQKIYAYSKSYRNRNSRQDILKKFNRITGNLSDIIGKTSTSQKVVKTTLWVISLGEALISLIIVLFISESMAAFNRVVSLPQLSLIFLAVFGSIRLLLEQLKNRFIKNWRWRTYQDIVDNAFHSISIAAGISCMLAFHVKQGTFLDEIDDLLEKGFLLLREPLSWEEKRRRRAAHQSSRILNRQRERLDAIQGSPRYDIRLVRRRSAPEAAEPEAAATIRTRTSRALRSIGKRIRRS